MKITIASRKSALAQIQSRAVGNALLAHHPQLVIDYKFSASAGDKDQDRELTSFGDKGAFTSDFYQGLVDGSYDLVVHSWKDLPIESRPKTK
ncbi:MAG: hydroxymethylbilane synthase, partial [Bdellovibrionales bacterium]